MSAKESSNCKFELSQKVWAKLLLKWLNKCVHPKAPVNELNLKSLVQLIDKYREDICDIGDDRAISCAEDVEPFINNKYPLLRLKNLWVDKDLAKKFYIMTSILLFHCCVNSKEGLVDCDIILYMDKNEQDMILSFCERLSDMEPTVNNVECAIKDACETVKLSPRRHQIPELVQKPAKFRSFKSESEEQSVSQVQSATLSSLKSSIISTVSGLSRTERMKKKFTFKSPLTITRRYKKPEKVQKPFKIISESEEQSFTQSSLKSSDISSISGLSPTGRMKKKFKSPLTIMPSVISESDVNYIVNYASKSEAETASKSGVESPSKLGFESKSQTSPDESQSKYEGETQSKSSRAEYTSITSETEPTSEADVIISQSDEPETDSEGWVSNKDSLTMNVHETKMVSTSSSDSHHCQIDCACSRCSPTGPCCGDPGGTMDECDNDGKKPSKEFWLNWNRMILLIFVVLFTLVIAAIVYLVLPEPKPKTVEPEPVRVIEGKLSLSLEPRIFQLNTYICKNSLCSKVIEPTSDLLYASLSRCILQCMGPQLWPYPIGYTHFSKKLVSLATTRLEYKFQSIPSEAVHVFIADAFKLFLEDLAKLEKYSLEPKPENLTRDMMIKKMYIQMDIETDPDPFLRLDTEEAYTIKVETINHVTTMKLLSASFCGMRNALETLSQLILLDQATGYLITLSHIVIKDAPSYKYRGLMLDTGRNYIPVPDIIRTIDGMASVKLNTFHWRISDVTSFPLFIPALPLLFEYGAYQRELIYTKDDVRAVVKRATVRGIRVVLEVAAPGPVGRAWSWVPDTSCPTKNKNYTCNNVLCLRLAVHDSVFDLLQIIYTEIIEMTNVHDVFHLSDGVFSLANCYYLIDEREGFLEKALERLKLANKGIYPKLPIIWYTSHLTRDYEARTWDRLGVQLTEWQPNPSDQFLNRFKVVHSSRWDLSCDVKKQRCQRYRTWQEMYQWKSWKNVEVFAIEGGEVLLWTDLVDSGNLDYHLWPRAAAVAERLWSDAVLNGTVDETVYVRLDGQRWRMVLKSIDVQPIWPLYCSFSPGICLQQLKLKNK